MPGAMKYDPQNTKIREAAGKELAARRKAAKTASDYYAGRHRKALKTQPNEPDDNITVNLAKTTVDRLAAFVAPRMPTFEIGEADGSQSAAEAWLARVWAEAGGWRTVTKLVKQGCLQGHVFARVQPDQNGVLRVMTPNPSDCVVFWKADDYEHVLWYEIHWQVGESACRQDVVRDGMGWVVRDWTRRHDENGIAGDAWRMVTEDRWDYPLGPILDWVHEMQPGSYYGAGEVEAGAVTLNDQVNKIASDMSRILRYHASPRTVGTGFEAAAVTETGIDHFWTIPSAEAKVFNLEMQSELAASLSLLDFLKGAYMAEHRVVTLRGAVSDFQRVTNLALRALFIDQLTKTEELRSNYEVGLIGISRRLLMLGGFEAMVDIRVRWADPLPVDPIEATETVARQLELKLISREGAARELGIDWALESQRIAGQLDDEAAIMERVLRQ